MWTKFFTQDLQTTDLEEKPPAQSPARINGLSWVVVNDKTSKKSAPNSNQNRLRH